MKKKVKYMEKKVISEINELANKCLGCKVKLCSNKGCPLNNDIPEFIKKVKENNYKEAYKILSKTTVLPGVCGKICPHEKQCQGSCIRGIKQTPVEIGELEAYVFEKIVEEKYDLVDVYGKPKTKINKKVAIIGGGPAGLTCAAFLAKEGVEVTIYEKYNYLGGLLVHGIPDFRLSKDTVKETVDRILSLGVEVKYGQELDKTFTLEELKEKYDDIFLAFGANVSSKMRVKGEELQGVFGGNELLEYNLHPDYKGKKVVVVGGGNVAMDCARTVNKKGALKTTVVYRRAREQMPAENKEIEDAIKEGVEFEFQNNIVQIIGKNKVEKIELIRTELVKKEGEKRLVPVNIPETNRIMEVDYIIMALGSEPEGFVQNLGLTLTKWGNIKVNENYQTSSPNIWAGGDLAGCKGTVAWAAKSGREVAKNILNKYKNNMIEK